jgi:uncharacterized membrane protein
VQKLKDFFAHFWTIAKSVLAVIGAGAAIIGGFLLLKKRSTVSGSVQAVEIVTSNNNSTIAAANAVQQGNQSAIGAANTVQQRIDTSVSSVAAVQQDNDATLGRIKDYLDSKGLGSGGSGS